MAIARVTSEALQEAVRRLLPSQAGFGVDLAASNVITPIIDLTPTAEGSGLAIDLQRAQSFQSANTFNFANSSGTVVNTPGFWLIQGTVNITPLTSNNPNVVISLSDGLTSKIAYVYRDNATGDAFFAENFAMTVFLASGESVTASATPYAEFTGTYRQIADVNGNTVNPKGFVVQ